MAEHTSYRATSEQWQSLDNNDCIFAYEACILELRARVEALEAANEARAVEIIKLTNAAAAQASSQAQFHADTTADEDDAAPTGSLVERVRQAQGCGNERDARAAIRAVALWLREQRGWEHGARELEREADRG